MNAQTCFYLMINFKLIKNFTFLCFHVLKNSKINHFNSIFKSGKFWGVTISQEKKRRTNSLENKRRRRRPRYPHTCMPRARPCLLQLRRRLGFRRAMPPLLLQLRRV